MTRVLAILIALLISTSAAANERWDGRWTVVLQGDLRTTCIAEVGDRGGAVAGHVTCPELGLRLPIDGTLAGDRATSNSPRFQWSASADAAGVSGTYSMDAGSGTWTATRIPE